MSKLSKRYTLGEEIFSSVSHGIGTLLAKAGTVVLIIFAALLRMPCAKMILIVKQIKFCY